MPFYRPYRRPYRRYKPRAVRRTAYRKKSVLKKRTYKPRSYNSQGRNMRGYISGHGAYKINKNSLLQGTQPAQFLKNGAAVEICHREYLGDVLSSASGTPSNFNLQNYEVNPGLPATFPWLSVIANNFQEYEFSGLIFYAKSLAADAIVASGTTNSIGTTIIATNYDVVQPNYINKQEMLESEFSSDAKISNDITHAIECSRKQSPVTHLYVRSGAIPAGGTEMLFDFCNTQIATVGVTSNSSTVCELWVSYHVRLYKPILQSGFTGNEILADKWYLPSCITTSPLGALSGRLLIPGSNLGVSINLVGTIITFPTWITYGTYFVMLRYVGTSTACTAPALTVGSGGTQLQVFTTAAGQDNANSMSSLTTNATTTFHLGYLINWIDGATVPFTLQFGTGGTIPTATCNADLIISCMPMWTS